MAQVDIVGMGNQPTTTYINLDDPARSFTSAPGVASKKARKRPVKPRPVAADDKEQTNG